MIIQKYPLWMSLSCECAEVQDASDMLGKALACEGKQFGAHMLVLFTCSP